MLDSPAKLQPRLDEIVASHLHREGPLLPILHDVQAEWGHIPDAAQPVIAHALNISKAEIHGVVTFYHDFRDHPAGRHTLRICRAEACQSMGGNATADAAKKALGIDWHGTTPDGAVTLEPVFCLGLCACAPAAQLDGQLHARVDADKLATLIAQVRA
jgi:formate dehydrogenase subunit gamma